MTRPRWLPIGFRVTAVALAALGLLSFGRRISDREPYTGVEWVEAAAGPTALAIDPASPGERAGLIPGDVLERIDGKPVHTAIGAADAPWRAPRGRALALDIRRGSQDVSTTLLPQRRRAAPRLYGFLALIGAACFASGALIVLRLSLIHI